MYMDKELMLRYFETTYEDPVGEILGDDPEYKSVSKQFFAKSDELRQLAGGINSPIWALFEEAMDEYHQIELIISKAMYLKGAEDREKMLK